MHENGNHSTGLGKLCISMYDSLIDHKSTLEGTKSLQSKLLMALYVTRNSDVSYFKLLIFGYFLKLLESGYLQVSGWGRVKAPGVG